MPTEQKPDLVVVDSGVLVVEYVKLPIADLHHNFLWRFIEPVPTVWRPGSLGIVASMVESVNAGVPCTGLLDLAPERVGRYARQEWDLATAPLFGDKHHSPCLKPIERVEVHECHIVRKP